MSLKKLAYTLCGVLAILSLSACSRHEPNAGPAFESAAGSVAAEAPAAAAAAPPAEGPSAAQLGSSAATYTDAQRKFIRTAQARFRVKDVYQSALAIEDAVAAQGGFVVSNQIGTEVRNVQRRPKGEGKLIELAEYSVRGDLSVRVPTDNTQAFLRSIIDQMEFLDRRGFEATDAQFALLRQQLAYQRNQEAQQELGQATQEGGKLGHKAEAIAARGEARSSRDEALIAQKEFEDKVAFSTIDLSLYQSPKVRQTEVTDVEAVFREHSPGFFPRLGDSLRSGWYGFLEALLYLIKFWSVWLLAFGALVWWRLFRK